MIRFIYLALCSIVLVGLLSNSARGDLNYSYKVDQSDYPTTPGATVTVRLFLQESFTAPTTSLLVNDNGLSGGGLRIDRQATALTVPTSIVSILPNSVDFAGLPITPAPTASSARFTESTALIQVDGVQAGNTGGGLITNPVATDRIFLGTLTLIAGTSPGATTFNIAPFDNSGGNTLTAGNNYDLDFPANNSPQVPVQFTYTGAGSSPPGSFTVTVSTPEPTSLAFLGFVAPTFLLRRRRVSA